MKKIFSLRTIDRQKENFLSAFLVFFLFSSHLIAQSSPPAEYFKAPVKKNSSDSAAPKIVRYDTSQILPRKFSSLKKYSDDATFQYERDRRPAQNAWEAFMRWLDELIGRFSRTKAGKLFWEVIYYVLIASILILVNYYLRKHGLYGSFYRDKGEKKISFSALDENIHEMNFDELISRAALVKNFPLAVRYLYLSVLKDASDAHLINWQIGKTNHEYIQEYSDPKKKNFFRDLTLLFEYAWYGEFDIDEEIFSDIQKRFQEFRSGMVKKA